MENGGDHIDKRWRLTISILAALAAQFAFMFLWTYSLFGRFGLYVIAMMPQEIRASQTTRGFILSLIWLWFQLGIVIGLSLPFLLRAQAAKPDQRLAFWIVFLTGLTGSIVFWLWFWFAR